jgi:poly(hydroxyalkanoate) granule-associated protein
MASSKHPKSHTGPASTHAEHATPPAQQVWLAGLGAMAKAQEQGSKAIEALLSDGLAFQRKSQAEAQQRLQEATERLTHMATDLGQTASVRVDKLEHLFEDRVAKALHRLGMPSLVDIQMLSERVAQLESQLQALQKAAAKPHKTAVSSTPSRQAQSAKTTKTPAVAAKSTARPAASPSAKKRQKSS